MPLVLIKEDGTGKPDANTYALAADGDAYHDGHLYATTWTGATTTNKEKALAMATRLIDGFFQFNGFKRLGTQALQWPRRACRDPDASTTIEAGLLLPIGPFLDETKVPAAVVNATAELARELLKADRTDDPDGEGISQLSLTGSLTIIFNPRDRQPIMPHVVQAMLSKYGALIQENEGVARLVRT